MEVRFQTDDLARIEAKSDFTLGLDRAIVRAFRKRVQLIRAARDERDLRAIRSHRFKKLQGERSHQYSMRLNDQWRLILEIEDCETGKRVVVVAIEDYH